MTVTALCNLLINIFWPAILKKEYLGDQGMYIYQLWHLLLNQVTSKPLASFNQHYKIIKFQAILWKQSAR